MILRERSTRKKRRMKRLMIIGIGWGLIMGILGCKDEKSLLQEIQFDYLKVENHTIVTNYPIHLTLSLDTSLTYIGKINFNAVYEKPNNVSAVTFINDSLFIAIHAEMHSDSSGGIDYSNLKPDTLNNIPFNSREQCHNLKEISLDTINKNPYFDFLNQKNFSFKDVYFMKQYFATDAEGTAEYILSYGKKVQSCEEKYITSRFKWEVDKESKQIFNSIEKY